MKYITAVFIVILVSCGTDIKTDTPVNATKDTSKMNSSYPAKIVKHGLEQWLDKAKWTMYCIYCDDTLEFEKQTGIRDTVTFASLDLRFANLEQLKDTTEIYLDFYYRDTIKCDINTIRNQGLANGVGFIKGSDSVHFYTSAGTILRFWRNDPSSRYKNPLQQDVIEYINNNKEKLHPWFYNEAKNRGLIP